MIDHDTYAARVRGMAEAATPGEWQWADDRGDRDADEGGIVADGGGRVLWLGDSEPYENSCGMCENPGDRAILAESKRIATAYLDAVGQIARLRRILAVEQGDESAAPPGWVVGDPGHWRRGNLRVSRDGASGLYLFRQAGQDANPRRFKTAFETMEAADAAKDPTP